MATDELTIDAIVGDAGEEIQTTAEEQAAGYIDNGPVPTAATVSTAPMAAESIQTSKPLQTATAGETSVFGGEVITEADFREQYEVIKVLGVGGQGKVLRAKYKNDGKTYTIKTMPLHENVQQVMAEARALQNIRNSHIQQQYHFYHITDTFTKVDELCLILEDFEGESLAKRLERGERSTEEQIDSIHRQTLEALAAAHAKGIIHRDLKPDNILINAEGYVKVIDFGLAKFLGEATHTSSAGKGSIAYMAPEQMRRSQLSRSKLYPSTDYYSLALIELDLARGSRRVDNPAIGQPIEEDLARMTHLSERFKARIQTMTVEDPEKRQEDWKKLLISLSIYIQKSSRPQQLMKYLISC